MNDNVIKNQNYLTLNSTFNISLLMVAGIVFVSSYYLNNLMQKISKLEEI